MRLLADHKAGWIHTLKSWEGFLLRIVNYLFNLDSTDMDLTAIEIVLLMVWLYLNQALFSLLRVRCFSAAGQFVFPFYLSFDQALIHSTMLSNSLHNLL